MKNTLFFLASILLLIGVCQNLSAQDKVVLGTNVPVGTEIALRVNEEAVVGDALQFTRYGQNIMGNPCKWYKVIRPEVEISGKITEIDATSFRLSSLDIKSAPDLEAFFAEDEEKGKLTIREADFSKCPKIQRIGIQKAQLKSVNLSGLSELFLLGLGANELFSIDVTGCNSLSVIFIHRNQIKKDGMKAFINSLPDRSEKDKGFVVVIDTHPDTKDEGNICSAEHVKLAQNKNWALKTASNEDYPGYDYQSHVSDEVIRLTTTLTLKEGVDNYIPLGITTYDGEDVEVEGGTYHSTSGGRRYYKLNSQNLVVKGKVKSFDCHETYLTFLDVSGNPELESLNCSANKGLSRLILGEPKKLKVLKTTGSPVGSIDVSKITTLEKLLCNWSNIPRQDLTGLVNLREINCSGNEWKSMDVRNCTKLERLFAAGCGLRSLDLSSNKQLRELHVYVNYLKELTFDSPLLYNVIAFDNEIEEQAMTNLVNSLPYFIVPPGADDFTPEIAQLVIYRRNNQPDPDKNRCTGEHVQTATERNWKVFSVDMDNNMESYEGNSLQPGITRPQVLVYPSPATEWVEVTNVEPGTLIFLYDSSGRSVSHTLSEDESTRIFVENLPSGIYYLSVGDGKLYSVAIQR